MAVGYDFDDPNAITKDVIEAHMDQFRKAISYWRAYPDRLIDFYCALNPENTFHLYFFQRVYLRAAMRYRDVHCVFPRGYSKSFLAAMSLMLKAILYPGASLFTVAGGKGQSASILQEKVEQICQLIPAMGKELVVGMGRGIDRSRASKDTVVYVFKNGSKIQNVAASEKTRGMRFQAGLMEECVSINQDILNQVIIPEPLKSRGCKIA